MTIWQQLKKPIFILAPMEDVTDTVFRQIVALCGRPDLFFTEFTNVEGLCSHADHIVAQRLQFTPAEKPIIAQVWGKNPDHYYEAAQKIVALGFDGIDINMGCPEKSVVKNGCCAALIHNRPLASEIIRATQDGTKGTIPVSVKTRIGYNTIVTDDWISFLLSFDLDALTIHGRTAKEQSAVPCHWDEIAKSVRLRNTHGKNTLIIGNGDIQSKQDAQQKVKEYGVDGVMIGRGALHNPFLFGEEKKWHDTSLSERLALLTKHLRLFESTWQGKKHYPTMKKYFKIYVSDVPGSSEMRARLMETTTPEQTRLCIEHMSHSVLQ